MEKYRRSPETKKGKTRYTSMTRQRFHELRKAWVDGSLLAKWEALQAPDSIKAKADEVEERQIRCIAMALQNLPELEALRLLNEDNKSWKEVAFLRDSVGTFFIEIYQ